METTAFGYLVNLQRGEDLLVFSWMASQTETFLLLNTMLTLALGSLTSSSHHIYDDSGNPTLIACVGDQLVLTCTHDMVSNQASQWNFFPTFPGCTRRIVNHNNPDSVSPCGPFMFLNVTGVDESPTELSSTTVATADESLNNTFIVCYDSERNSANLVGNITLCIIGQTQIDGNISIISSTDVTEVSWDPFVFQECAADFATVISTVTVTTLSGEPAGRVLLTGETSAIILNTMPNQEYKVSVEVQVSFLDTVTHSCDIGRYQEVFHSSKQSQNTTDITESTTVTFLSTSEAVILTCLLTLTFSLAIGLITGSLLTWIIISKKTQEPVQLPVNQPEAEYEEVCATKSESAKQAFEMGENVAYSSVREV